MGSYMLSLPSDLTSFSWDVCCSLLMRQPPMPASCPHDNVNRVCPGLPLNFCSRGSPISDAYPHPQSLGGQLKFHFLLQRFSPAFTGFYSSLNFTVLISGKAQCSIQLDSYSPICYHLFLSYVCYQYSWAFVYSSRKKKSSDWTMCLVQNADLIIPCLPSNTICKFLVDEKHSFKFVQISTGQWYCAYRKSSVQEKAQFRIQGSEPWKYRYIGGMCVWEYALIWREENMVIKGKYFLYKQLFLPSVKNSKKNPQLGTEGSNLNYPSAVCLNVCAQLLARQIGI